ncbi:MAG: NAD(P)H-hydrate dehydratase [Planctomycetota bacterium]
MTSPAPDPPPTLPVRPSDGHKGTFGTVAVVGGCALPGSRMLGAPALAARAAARVGAGLVRLACPAPVLDAALALADHATGRAIPVDAEGGLVPHESAAIIDDLAANATVLVVGPGLGRGAGSAAAVLRAVQQREAIAVIDADALNELAATPQLALDFHAPAVLTPHPGEYARLAAALGLPQVPRTDGERREAAAELARRLGCIVVLKGARTVVSDGYRHWADDTADAALAAGGTGDVLAGAIAGLAAQFARPPVHERARARLGDRAPRDAALSLYDVARGGVRAHALAAAGWRAAHDADAGLLPAELADALPAAIASMRAPG